MKIKWVEFKQGQRLPAERRLVFVQIDRVEGYPPSVAVGYLRYAAGDLDSPQFIVPGFGRPFVVTHWSSNLPHYFAAPLWSFGLPHGRGSRIWT